MGSPMWYSNMAVSESSKKQTTTKKDLKKIKKVVDRNEAMC